MAFVGGFVCIIAFYVVFDIFGGFPCGCMSMFDDLSCYFLFWFFQWKNLGVGVGVGRVVCVRG